MSHSEMTKNHYQGHSYSLNLDQNTLMDFGGYNDLPYTTFDKLENSIEDNFTFQINIELPQIQKSWSYTDLKP